MFVSLNKKFIYTILVFFLFTSTLFIYTFYMIYGVRFQEEQKSNLARNQQYIELLVENGNYRKEIRRLLDEYPQIDISSNIKIEIINHIDENNWKNVLTKEKIQTEEILKNYDDRYLTIKQGIKIVGASSILLVIAIILVWFLMRRWVLAPLNNLSIVSNEVSFGNISKRVTLNDKRFFIDEIDILSNAFNTMLSKLEQSIKEIREKETFLQSLIDSIPDGLRVIDKDYNIIVANREYYRQVGRNKQCKKCYAASRGLDHPCPDTLFTCPLREILENGKNNVKAIQQFSSHPNRHLSINAAPLYHNNNDTPLVVEVIRDLSDDIKFSHQQKLSSLGFMATSVAHEMKNHLGSIRIITERLLDKYYAERPNDDEEKQLMNLVYKQLVECINVPERLLRLARYSDDELLEINCLDSIKDVIALLDYEAKHKGIAIEVEATSSNISVLGYEADFKMIIVNMILNAIKAITQSGIIKIEISEYRRNVIIKISDNGRGIPADKLSRIFEPFYSEGKDNRNGGTGLGLSIVKSIIEKFRGSISVASENGNGTCFTMKFPNPDKKITLQK